MQCSVRKDIKYSKQDCIQEKPDFDHPFFHFTAGKNPKASNTGKSEVEIQRSNQTFSYKPNSNYPCLVI